MIAAPCITLVGPSGSGITTISKELESMGYDLISRVTPETLQKDAELREPHVYIPKIWDALDAGIPMQGLADYAKAVCHEIQKCRGNITIFLSAEIPVLTKRQEENRLKTRLSQEYNLPHQQALQIEQQMLQPFNEIAQIKLNTTRMRPILARRSINLCLSLEIPFETDSYEKLVDHVASDFFHYFGGIPVIEEIMSQQQAARDFVNQRSAYRAVLDPEAIARSNGKVFLVGEGSSLMALKSAAWLLHKGYRQTLQFYPIPASDLRFSDIEGAIVVICSNSGNTAEIRQNISEKRFKAASLVIGLTNQSDSALGEFCKTRGVLIPLAAPAEKAIAATVSYFKSNLTAVAILARIGDILNGDTRNGVKPGQTKCYDAIFEDVAELPDRIRELFSRKRISTIAVCAKKMARGLGEARHGYLTAAGLLSDCLLAEASLKAKELARIHLEPVFNSLFHGPLNPDVSAALYLQDPLVNTETMVRHIEKLNLYIPTVTSIGPHDCGVPNVPIPRTTPVNSVMLHLITLQLMYFLIGIEQGFCLDEIQYPIRLSKVVQESPLG